MIHHTQRRSGVGIIGGPRCGLPTIHVGGQASDLRPDSDQSVFSQRQAKGGRVGVDRCEDRLRRETGIAGLATIQ